MGKSNPMPQDGDLITVQEFAEKFRVDSSIVRSWVKRGLIDYVLVGPRNMRCVRRSDILKPIQPRTPPHIPVTHVAIAVEATELMQALMSQGMDIESAQGVVGSMDLDGIKSMLIDLGGTNG